MRKAAKIDRLRPDDGRSWQEQSRMPARAPVTKL
jgi:hypothetical protein